MHEAHISSGRGFTLVELLVVIGALGILAAIFVSSFDRPLSQSEAKKHHLHVEQVRVLVEQMDSDGYDWKTIGKEVGKTNFTLAEKLIGSYHYIVKTAKETSKDIPSCGGSGFSPNKAICPKRTQYSLGARLANPFIFDFLDYLGDVPLDTTPRRIGSGSTNSAVRHHPAFSHGPRFSRNENRVVCASTSGNDQCWRFTIAVRVTDDGRVWWCGSTYDLNADTTKGALGNGYYLASGPNERTGQSSGLLAESCSTLNPGHRRSGHSSNFFQEKSDLYE